MAADKLIPANIVIADRQYRIKVAPNDEQTVRQSVKLINDKIVDYKTSFPGFDMQDYVSMVLIWFATEFKNTSASVFDEKDILSKLSQIETLVDTELK